jgi:hypothetical protein
VPFDNLGTDTLLFLELHRREEEVDQEGVFVAVEIVHEGNDLRVIEALVAEVLTDMGPIASLDMRVVIFLVLT